MERYFQNRAIQLLSTGTPASAPPPSPRHGFLSILLYNHHHHQGWRFTGQYERLEWGAVTSAVHEDNPSKVYHTAYIYADKRYPPTNALSIHMRAAVDWCGNSLFVWLVGWLGRAKGVFTGWIKSHPDYTIVTTPDCELEAFLAKHSIPFTVAHKPQFEEYAMVERFYGNKVTRRTGIGLLCCNTFAWN